MMGGPPPQGSWSQPWPMPPPPQHLQHQHQQQHHDHHQQQEQGNPAEESSESLNLKAMLGLGGDESYAPEGPGNQGPPHGGPGGYPSRGPFPPMYGGYRMPMPYPPYGAPYPPGPYGPRMPFPPGMPPYGFPGPMPYGLPFMHGPGGPGGPGPQGDRQFSGRGGRGRGQLWNPPRSGGGPRHHQNRAHDGGNGRLEALIASISPLPEEFERRRLLLAELQGLVSGEWAQAEVHAYGSSATKYCLRSADMDICLLVDESVAAGLSFSEDLSELGIEVEAIQRSRTKPEAGRFAVDHWRTKQEEIKERRAELKARREAEAADDEGAPPAEAEDDFDAAAAQLEENAPPAPDIAIALMAAAAAEEAAASPRKRNDSEAVLEEPEEEEKKELTANQKIVLRLAQLLKEGGLTKIVPLPRARVPIVKFAHPGLGVSCDICINKRLGLRNTALLNAYAELDPRVVQLSVLIKHWAKQRNINCTYEGTLSSYAYVILVIFFLQTRRQPLLPVLQEVGRPAVVPPEDIVDGHDVYFCRDPVALRKLGYGPGINPNREPLGQLLIDFFKYYAHEFSFHDDVVSIRKGIILAKEEKHWTPEEARERQLGPMRWCIEDPFDLDHNLGRVADRGSLFTMRGEFMRATKIFRSDRPRIDELFEKFVPPPEPQPSADGESNHRNAAAIGAEQSNASLLHSASAPAAMPPMGASVDPSKPISEADLLAALLGNASISSAPAPGGLSSTLSAPAPSVAPSLYPDAVFGAPSAFGGDLGAAFHAAGYGGAFPGMSMGFPGGPTGGSGPESN